MKIIAACLVVAVANTLVNATSVRADDPPTTPIPAASPAAAAMPASSADDLTVSGDRGGFATPTNIVPLHHYQLEGGFQGARTGPQRSYDFGQLVVRMPLTDRAEFRVGVPSYLVNRGGGPRTSGADDSLLETKIVLSKRPRVTYGMLLNVILPTGSQRVAEHTYQPGATLLADVTLTDSLSASLNMGVVHATNNGARFNQTQAAASFSYAWCPVASTFAEVFQVGQPAGPAQRYFDIGAVYTINPRTAIDTTVGIGLGNHAGGPDYFYGAGVARLF